MRFGSVCSGIEAASVAWEPLGWTAAWVSEIEAFPSAVLAHHWPDVPNLGDMLALPALMDAGEIEAPDVLVGGCPCQSFSLAGRRESLSDPRGNLTLAYVELADAIDRQRTRDGREPCAIVYENVPGILSTKDNAFGCFLAGLAGEDEPLLPPGKRWTNAGVVLGPKRAVAWRILDAQYFGLAQRRRRVFVVASARDGFDPSQVLLEFDGLRRDSAPRRETRQETAGDAGPGFEVAGTLDSRVSGGGFPGSDGAMGGHVVPTPYHEVAHCLNAGGMGRIDYETESFVVNAAIPILEPGARTGKSTTDVRAGLGVGDDGDPMFTLQAGKQHGVAFAQNTRDEVRLVGGDGSLVGALAAQPGMKQTSYVAVSTGGDIAHTLNTANNGKGCSEDGTGRGVPTIAHTVALRGREGGATAEVGGEVATALRASSGGGDKPHVLASVPAIGLQTAVTPKFNHDLQFTLTTPSPSGGGQPAACMDTSMAVRRLTPTECEFLQGFPRDHTLIPYGRALKGEAKEELARYFERTGQYMRQVSEVEWVFDRERFEKEWPAMAADGPRYKALGNSMAVPCMRWIGSRIQRHLDGDL